MSSFLVTINCRHDTVNNLIFFRAVIAGAEH